MLLTLLIGLGCAFPPSKRDILEDLEMRRARSQYPQGECWMRDRVGTDLDPTVCVPGPWLATNAEYDAYWASMEGWQRREWDPDELLVLGVSTSGLGGPAGLISGAAMQRRALEAGPDPALVERLSVHHRTRDELWAQVVPDATVHELGLIVVDEGGWRDRLAWARLRDAIDQHPTPTPDQWEEIRPEDGTPEALMWPSLELYDKYLRAADRAWAAALADAPASP